MNITGIYRSVIQAEEPSEEQPQNFRRLSWLSFIETKEFLDFLESKASERLKFAHDLARSNEDKDSRIRLLLNEKYLIERIIDYARTGNWTRG